MADSTAKEASLTLQNETDTDVVKITAKYVGERGNNFKLTIAPSLANEGTFDMKLYENTALLYTYSFATWAELIDTVNTANVYILASKAEGSLTLVVKILKNITSQALTGGNSGITGIANTDYIKLLDVLETQEFNILSLDGVTDEAIQTSIASWVTRMRTQGKKIMCVMGGSSEDDVADDAVEKAVQRSAGFNHEGVINIGTGIILDDVKYSSADLAPYVAGLIAGQKMTESTTYAATPFDDVTRRWTRSEQETAVTNGVFYLLMTVELLRFYRELIL